MGTMPNAAILCPSLVVDVVVEDEELDEVPDGGAVDVGPVLVVWFASVPFRRIALR